MTLEERIERLERSNRRLRGTLASLLLIGGLALVVGFAAPDPLPELIEAKAFRVVTDDGVPLVTLDAYDVPSHSIENRDPAESAYGAVGVTTVGAITTYDRRGHALVTIRSRNRVDDRAVGDPSSGALPAPVGSIDLLDHDGVSRVLLAAGVGVRLRNDHGQNLVSIGARDGAGNVITWDGTGESLVDLGASEGVGEIDTWSAYGDLLVSIGARDGKGRLIVRDPEGASAHVEIAPD